MKNALRVVLASLLAAPAGAGLPLAKGESQAALQGVANLAETAQAAATLEHGNHSLNRAYDVAAADTPAPATGASQSQPAQLQPPPAEPGAHFASVPRPPDGEDKEDTSAAEAKAKAKKDALDLKRAAMGGLGGAIVLGVVGLIFGGPIVAVAAAAAGFGLLAGVTYLNNNPIK